MQFIPQGPDVPEALLQAHAEGKVVFFCGAGISIPAGLPGFKDLAIKIYKDLSPGDRTPAEKQAIKLKQFDRALGLLEARLPGQRLALTMRRTLADILLKPKLDKVNSTKTHAALLDLACHQDLKVRLVTTNFDRLFEPEIEKIIVDPNRTISTYVAPLLPIPKKTRWDGLVYLHGRLPPLLPADTESHRVQDEQALENLVITSGDLGRAYLLERWAARFISELLRNYVICFVGYSLDDPIMRYVMDARDVDMRQGEGKLPAYQFIGSLAMAGVVSNESITPIFYDVKDGHAALHKTLDKWASSVRDGASGAEEIVLDCALRYPTQSTAQDKFAERLYWALSHPSGLPAKCFAELDPVPTLAWLPILEAIDKAKDAAELEAKKQSQAEPSELKESHRLLRPLFSSDVRDKSRGIVSLPLVDWLVQYLGEADLFAWVLSKLDQGGCLHPYFRQQIIKTLKNSSPLKQEGEQNSAGLSESRPTLSMPNAWRLLLAGRVTGLDTHDQRAPAVYSWGGDLQREGLSLSVRLNLRACLNPRVRWQAAGAYGAKVVLASDQVYAWFQQCSKGQDWYKDWCAALPKLLFDFDALLRDALDLWCELGKDDRCSRMPPSFYIYLPSIARHPQNQQHDDWYVLIELLRDAWLALYQNERQRAGLIAQTWFAQPYVTYKRLALFAATHDDCVDVEQWVDWLLAEDARCLWFLDGERETMRLLTLQARSLKRKPEAAERLEAAILAGSPRWTSDISSQGQRTGRDEAIWQRLAKLNHGGHRLGLPASECFTALSRAHPEWNLPDDQRDEFPRWSVSYRESGFKGPSGARPMTKVPRRRCELLAWLKQISDEQGAPYFNDWSSSWSEVCRNRFFHSCYALCDLAEEKHWPFAAWHTALQAWGGDEPNTQRSWRYAASTIAAMPEPIFQKLHEVIARWLHALSAFVLPDDERFFSLCQRVLDLALAKETDASVPPHTDGFVAGYINAASANGSEQREVFYTQALNSPVGFIARAFCRLWLQTSQRDGDALSRAVAERCTQLCQRDKPSLRPARTILAQHLAPLFRADPEWTKTHLLPCFRWSPDNFVGAQAAWSGFLYGADRHPDLLLALKQHLLDTTQHYAQLSNHVAPRFVDFFTDVALDSSTGFTRNNWRDAIKALPEDGLERLAARLLQRLEHSEKPAEFWRNRVRVFWQKIWPKSTQRMTEEIARLLALWCLAAGDAFPEVLKAVQHHLQALNNCYQFAVKLQSTQLSSRFPKEMLSLFAKLIAKEAHSGPQELRGQLDEIAKAAPELCRTPEYRRLDELMRRYEAS